MWRITCSPSIRATVKGWYSKTLTAGTFIKESTIKQKTIKGYECEGKDTDQA